MEKIKLGGIKLLEKRSHAALYCRGDDSLMLEICGRIAAERNNLALLATLPDTEAGESITTLCTDSADLPFYCCHLLGKTDEIGQSLWSAGPMEEIDIVTIFPHAQRPSVAGRALRLLEAEHIHAIGLASSSSAVSLLVSPNDTGRLIDRLFQCFELSTCTSPLQWHAAYQGQNQMLREIVCSYEEKVIKTYEAVRHCDLDLWTTVLPGQTPPPFGAALERIGESGATLPFLAAARTPQGNLAAAFSLPSHKREETLEILSADLPHHPFKRVDAVAVFHLHGPHFGDRHGIAYALLRSLHAAGIKPLALSCAVSSMSIVVHMEELNRAIESLSPAFHIPAACR